MNFLHGKKSSAFRNHGSTRVLTAWLAVLVQLHLFFVLELHHHVLGPRLLRDAAMAGATWTKSNTAQPPRPLCPACQVARQGAVQPAVERVLRLPLQGVVGAPQSQISTPPAVFLFHSSGRDPPRV